MNYYRNILVECYLEKISQDLGVAHPRRIAKAACFIMRRATNAASRVAPIKNRNCVVTARMRKWTDVKNSTSVVSIGACRMREEGIRDKSDGL